MKGMKQMKKYYAINDGYGIVGYGFTCNNCQKEHNFVDTEESEQICSSCKTSNQMIPYNDEEMDFWEYASLGESDEE